MEVAAKSFSAMIKRGEQLTPNQMSYVDGIYERVMDNLGFGGAKNIHKGNRRTE
jgi:hypothetical protein